MISGQLFETGLTTQQAAKRLGISRGRLSQLVGAGEVRADGHVGRIALFLPQTIDRLARRSADVADAALYKDCGLTAIEAAHLIGIMPRELMPLVRRHDIPHRRIYGMVRFLETDIQEFAAQSGRPFRCEPSDPTEQARYRQQCRMVARCARRSGRLKPSPCEMCGAPKVHGHHDDYTRPLVVRWLCQKCHAALHESLSNPKPKRTPSAPRPRKKTVCGLTHDARRERMHTMIARIDAGEAIDVIAAEFDVSAAYLSNKSRAHKK